MLKLRNADTAKVPPGPAVHADRRGAVAIEYALLGSMVAIVAIGGLMLLGDSTTGLWGTVGDEVGGAIGGAQAVGEQ
jgi:Flp pilus assembly pilin Flp